MLSGFLPGSFLHVLDFLGFEIYTVSGQIAVRAARWALLQDTFRRVRRFHPHRVPAKLLASAVGRASSTYHATGDFSRIGVRPLAAILGPLTDTASSSYNRWNTRLELSTLAWECIDLWLSTSRTDYTAPIWSSLHLPQASIRALYGPEHAEPSHLAFTDAGAYGWGGHCDSLTARGYLTPDQQKRSSTWRELWAIWQFLQTLLAARPLLRALVLFTDSDNARHILRRGSSHPDHQALAFRIFSLCRNHSLILQPRWIPRRFNEFADYLAGIVDLDDWKLHPTVFTFLDNLWGPHAIDAFASDLNKHARASRSLPFYSLHWCPGTSGVDAFSQDWSSSNLWCNPPSS